MPSVPCAEHRTRCPGGTTVGRWQPDPDAVAEGGGVAVERSCHAINLPVPQAWVAPSSANNASQNAPARESPRPLESDFTLASQAAPFEQLALTPVLHSPASSQGAPESQLTHTPTPLPSVPSVAPLGIDPSGPSLTGGGAGMPRAPPLPPDATDARLPPVPDDGVSSKLANDVHEISPERLHELASDTLRQRTVPTQTVLEVGGPALGRVASHADGRAPERRLDIRHGRNMAVLRSSPYHLPDLCLPVAQGWNAGLRERRSSR